MEISKQNNYWWFGVNNRNKRHVKSKAHVIYPEISSFLNGQQEYFEWPYGGTKVSNIFYKQMRPNDKVLLWMGDGDFKKWGIIGFALIKEIKYGSNINSNLYVLKFIDNETNILTPYPNKKPMKTEQTEFLKNTFGLQFRPLRKTFNLLGYKGINNYVITIDKIEVSQYEKIMDYLLVSNDIKKIRTIKNSFDVTASEDIAPIPDIDDIINSAIEGKAKLRKHLRRERNRKLVISKKRQVLSATGKLKCEVCGFDFEDMYGEIGHGFCEVHHLKLLSDIEKEVETKLEDLAIVCSNCHRMIHLNDPMLSLIQLRQKLKI